MDNGETVLDERFGQILNQLPIAWRQLLSRPKASAQRIWIECGDVQLVDRGPVMIACDTDVWQRIQALNALVGLWPVANDIAQTPNLIKLASISENRLKSSQIAVDIR
jgi:hypothetical protein